MVICLLAVAGVVLARGDGESGPILVAKTGFYYVGGREFSYQGQTAIVDQMYVQYQIPAKVTSPYPIVMIHGTFQSGTIYMGTPGRPGKAGQSISCATAILCTLWIRLQGAGRPTTPQRTVPWKILPWT